MVAKDSNVGCAIFFVALIMIAGYAVSLDLLCYLFSVVGLPTWFYVAYIVNSLITILASVVVNPLKS